jgi:hypothetical protein
MDVNNNDDTPAKPLDAESTPDSTGCAPGCACGEPAGKGNNTIKIAVCLVVAVAVFGILLFKMTSSRQSIADTGASGFSNPLAKKSSPVLNSTSQPGGTGVALAAIADLNTVADKTDTVFLIVPGKDNAPAAKETGAALASVERTLNAKGLSTGVFTLKTASPDYPDVAAKMIPPGIAVLTKGRGIGFVSGGISETNLMQAYVASTRGGGCGPGGCPPASDGKPKVPCN